MRFQLHVRVHRGQVLGSRHELHAALADPDGRLLASAESTGLVTMFRSSAKPFQLLPLVERGHAERWGFGGEQLALLRGGGAERSPLYNNCSGNHAGLLALARSEGWPVAGYPQPDHPVQQLLHRTIAEVCAVVPESIPTAVDGCSLVVYALPLLLMALLSRGQGLAIKCVDGAQRAIGPAAVAVLEQLGVLSGSEIEALAAERRTTLFNAAGLEVGQVTADLRVVALA